MAGFFSSSNSILFALLSLCGIKTGCIPTAKEILVHIRLVQQIKQAELSAFDSTKVVTDQNKSAKLTQTEAYLRVNQSLVDAIWGKQLTTYKSIIDQVMSKESELKDDYYVFYHAQQSYNRIFHDLMNETYQLLAMEPDFKDFRFLRAWFNSPEKINVHEFFSMYESFLSTSWQYFDSQQMLCANLALFGNSNSAYECTFFYFVNNANIIPPSLYVCLQEFLDTFKFDHKFINDLLDLGNMATTQEGLLYQIFIPKNQVDKYAYLSYVGTAPWNKPVNTIYFDTTKKRHTALSPILEQYCNDPFSIPEIDRIQARILLSQDLLLNPKSGIKVYRYTTLDPKIDEVYQLKLKNVLNEMVTHWLDNHKIRKQLAQLAILQSMPLGQFLKDFKPKT